jgi:hypothetical protein
MNDPTMDNEMCREYIMHGKEHRNAYMVLVEKLGEQQKGLGGRLIVKWICSEILVWILNNYSVPLS